MGALSFITDSFKATKHTTEQKRQLLKARIVNSPYHRWLKDDQLVARNILTLIDMLPGFALDTFLGEKHLTFVASNGQMSCALSSLEKQHVIIIFPELYKLLRSVSFEHGLSVIAHEIGHIVYNHPYTNIGTLEAQIEADRFVYKIGLGEELQETLLDSIQNDETRVRVSYLTSEIVSKK